MPKNAAILEVGCGSGRLLLDLAWLGFTNLTGVDPFIAEDIHYPDGPKILKQRVETMTGEFDLVMLHHSFEHTDQPLAVMQAVSRLLKPGGYAIFRIPVASSFAWRQYGVNWANLDAPPTFFPAHLREHEIACEPDRTSTSGNFTRRQRRAILGQRGICEKHSEKRPALAQIQPAQNVAGFPKNPAVQSQGQGT